MRLPVLYWTAWFVASCGHLTVMAELKQQYFRVKPMDEEVIEGQSMVISCEVTNQEGMVQWSKDGFVLGFDRNIPGYPRYHMVGDPHSGVNNLRIENAQLEDDGDYQCQVGPSGRNKAIRAAAHLKVLLPPKSIEIVGYQNATVKEVRQQDTVTLTCLVKAGKPGATIKWYRKNIELRAADNIRYHLNPSEKHTLEDAESTITLNPNPDDNGATYTCEAVHPALLIPLRRTIGISVLFPPGPPEITGYQEGETVRMGDTLTLTCTSRGGNPLAQLVWYKDDHQVDFSYTTSGRESTNTYTLDVNSSDNNAIYKCEASNVVSPVPMVAMIKLTVHFSPSNVYISGPKESKTGDVVTMTCITARSNPAAEVSWVVDGRPEKGVSTVVADPLGGWVTSTNITTTVTSPKQNMKMFSCYAINHALGETIVETLVVSILYPPDTPTIFGYSEGTFIKAGALQRLTCVSHGGNPLPTIKWFKKGTEIDSSTSTNGNVVSSEITIVTKDSDNGADYRCQAKNSATPTALSTKIKLTVHFPPSAVNIKVKPKRPKAGEKVVLHCESKSSNPPSSITWWKDGFVVVNTYEKIIDGMYGGKITTNELHLNVTAKDDGSVYTCQATNHLVQHSVHDAATLVVLYKPEFETPQSEEFSVTEGDAYVINLTANANPSAISYTWTRNGKAIPAVTSTAEQNDIAPNHVFSSGPILNISGAQKGDTGNYTLKAENQEGNTEITIIVQVHYSAKVKKIIGPGIVSEGENILLQCVVDALPVKDRMVTWKRENFDMSRTEQSDKGVLSTLLIYNASASDSGEFECHASNGIGEADVRSLLVVVKHKPSIINAPEHSKSASDAGRTAKIFCRASGVPNVTFAWSREGANVGDMSKQDQTKYSSDYYQVDYVTWESVLYVSNVQTLDYGIYQCIARNDLGFTSKNIQLNATTHPDPPVAVRVINFTHNSVDIEWSPGFDGGQTQSYRVRYKRTDSPSFSYIDVYPLNSTSFTVTGLDLGTEYSFNVLSKNVHGESNYSLDIIKAKTSSERPVTETEKIFTTAVVPGKYEIPKLIIICVSVVGSLLLILNVILVVCFVRKRRKKRLEEESDQSSSKAATIEMYAPSSYNETVNGETLSSTSEKSENYSDGHSTGGYSEEPGKPAASTYLIDQGEGVYIADGSVHQYSPYRYPDEVISTLNRSPKLPHRAIVDRDDEYYSDALRRNAYNQRLGDKVVYGKTAYPPPPPGRTAASGAAESQYNYVPDTRYIPFPVSPAGTRANHIAPVLSTFSPTTHGTSNSIIPNHVLAVTHLDGHVMIQDELDGHLV